MFGLTAFDPVQAALEGSDSAVARGNRVQLAADSAVLQQMFQGNQLGRVHAWIDTFVQEPSARPRYHDAAVFLNITKFLVEHSSTVGQHPVRVLWRNADDARSENYESQKLWERILRNFLKGVKWREFISSLMVDQSLLKTVVARPGWDAWNDCLELYHYTPDEIDVGYSPGNLNRALPDQYVITIEPATRLRVRWDFSPCREGKPALVTTLEGESVVEKKASEVIDPLTNRSLNPFIPFRTRAPRRSFFVWDGQPELIKAQDFINELYTQLALVLQHGSFRQAILSGPGWGDVVKLPNCITIAIKEPEDPLGRESGKEKIRWGGPDVAPVIAGLLSAIDHWTDAAALSLGINASAFRVGNEARSGMALTVEGASLRDKHARTRNAAEEPLLQLVQAMRYIWNQCRPKGEAAFPDDVEPEILIPDYGSSVTVATEVSADIALKDSGLRSVESLLYKYNPGLSPEAAERMLADAERLTKASDAAAADAKRTLQSNQAPAAVRGGSSRSGSFGASDGSAPDPLVAEDGGGL